MGDYIATHPSQQAPQAMTRGVGSAALTLSQPQQLEAQRQEQEHAQWAAWNKRRQSSSSIFSDSAHSGDGDGGRSYGRRGQPQPQPQPTAEQTGLGRWTEDGAPAPPQGAVPIGGPPQQQQPQQLCVLSLHPLLLCIIMLRHAINHHA